MNYCPLNKLGHPGEIGFTFHRAGRFARIDTDQQILFSIRLRSPSYAATGNTPDGRPDAEITVVF